MNLQAQKRKNLSRVSSKTLKKARSTILKVVSGFALIALVLFFAITITYNNLSQVSGAVKSIAVPNHKLVKLKQVAGTIYDIESYARAYIIYRDPVYFEKYDRAISYVNTRLDTLALLYSSDKPFLQEIDTLKGLVNARLGLFNEYIRIKTGQEGEDIFAKLLRRLPVYTAKQQAAQKAVENIPGTASEEGDAKRNFFSRLFGRKKKDVLPADTLFAAADQVQAKPAPAEQQQIRSLITRAQRDEMEREQELLSREFELIQRDNLLTNQTIALISRLEQQELAEGIQRVDNAAVTATEKVFSVSLWLGIFGGIIALGFCYFIYRDIVAEIRFKTQILQAKRHAEKLAKAKEEFLANMSHEIRTPMNVIVGFSEQIQKTKLDDNQFQLFQGIRRSSSHLLTILNEILDYSKIEAGKLEMESIGFRVRDIFNDVFVSLNSIAESKKLHFACVVSERVPEVLMGDPVRLKQVLINLGGNAIKFTAQGAVEIFCDAHVENKGHSVKLKLAVKDTGIGIHQEKIESIFEGFNQGDTSVTRRYGGTGLGLAISRKLVELQGGNIEVKSEVGKGSAFHVYLPFRAGQAEDLLKEEGIESFDYSMLKGKRALVVDDDEMNKKLAQMVLEGWGMEVVLADNGEEAISRMRDQEFDVVLMDLQMPVMGGLEAMKRIRKELNGHKAHIPVIAVTGNAIKGEEQKCIDSGMSDYLTKPFRERMLYNKILKVLEIQN